ncbi:MAG TPA: ABC transporter permease, partial [Terriglobales bacterium]|nr:ABC transporter permease [Terriglobales bacterium]
MTPLLDSERHADARPSAPGPRPADPRPRAGGRGLPSRRVLRFLQHQGALVALIVACLFGFARYATFLTPTNLLNVLRQNSMVGIVALGMTFVILTAGIDLSVGALLAVAGIVAATLSPQGTLVAVLGGVGVAALLGVVNGVVITKARIQPFVVTLAMMIAARGVALAVTEENSVRVATEATGLSWLGRGFVGPIPVPVLL